MRIDRVEDRDTYVGSEENSNSAGFRKNVNMVKTEISLGGRFPCSVDLVLCITGPILSYELEW